MTENGLATRRLNFMTLATVQNWRQNLALADQARDRRDWASAIFHYQLYLRVKPNSFAIWVQLGHALKESDRKVDALTAYSKALSLNDLDSDLLLNLGHLCKLMGLVDDAVNYYSLSVKIDNNHHAKAELAALGVTAPTTEPAATTKYGAKKPASNAGMVARSLRALVKKLTQSEQKRLIVLGNKARDSRDWPAAAESYQSYLEANPSDFAIWVQLGHALKEAGRLNESLLAYDEALQRQPSDADLLLSLGHLHKKMELREEAIAFYRRSAEIDGNIHAVTELRGFGLEPEHPVPSTSPAPTISSQGLEFAAGATAEPTAPTAAPPFSAPASETPSAVPPTPSPASKLRPATAEELNAPFVGSLDEIYQSVVSGWVWDPRSPDTPATVEFFIADRLIHTVTAHMDRPDVRDIGAGGGRAGFLVTIPIEKLEPDMQSGQIMLHARLAGTDIELNNSPRPFDMTFARAIAEPTRVPHVSTWRPSAIPIRAIALYLPQYHPFPENNEWWGAGFTEWSNVTRARPQFVGHQQPHRPGELGYYDLRVPEIQERQAELAQLFGIGGFCFYFYWFSGHILMERPIRQYTENPNITLPFCICWANENWTRRWDGMDSEILIAQQYSDHDDIAFIQHISQYMIHKNYIRIDNRPVLIIYRIERFPDPKATAKRWREYCRTAGIGEIYLVCTHAFSAIDPHDVGFDAAMEFPPNNSKVMRVDPARLNANSDFSGEIYDYSYCADKANEFTPTAYPLLRSVFTSWDNTARRRNAGVIFINSDATKYLRYLESVATQVINSKGSQDEQLVFINAWNEWAEGARLEPDESAGYAYLEATRMALIRASSTNTITMRERFGRTEERPHIAVVVHAFYLDVLDELIPMFSEYPDDVEFFFTTPTWQASELRMRLAHFHYRHEIIEVENRGRDVAPFLRVLNHIWKRNFKYILKLHTKKSMHRQDGADWRNDIFRTIATPSQIAAIIHAFEARTDIGIIGPANHVISMATHWGSNADRVLGLSRRLGFSDIDVARTAFVAGTMFVARLEALEPLIALSLTTADFEPEAGQVDGTLAHAIERALTFCAAAVGLRISGAGLPDAGGNVLSEQIFADYLFAAPTISDT